MHIQRDRSHLHFGRARRSHPAVIVVWGVLIVIIIGVLWRFEQAQDWALSVLGKAPTPTLDAVTWAQQGERAYLAGNVAGAIDAYGRAAALEPGQVAYGFEYGRVLIYRSYAGRTFAHHAAEALAVAEQLIAIAPNDARAQALYSWALLENGRIQETITPGLRATQLAPDFAEGYAYLAMAYQQAGSYTSMVDTADRAVQINPHSVDARRALGLALTTMGQFDAAIEQYEYALQVHPRLDALYFELAQVYRAQQNYEAAIAAYQQILTMEPDNVKAYTRICLTYYTIGEWARAQEACDQATLLDPTYPEAFQQLGKVRYKNRNFEGAVEALQTCADLQTTQGLAIPDHEVDCYYIRGLALAYLARCDQAWPLFEDALLMDSTPDETQAIHDGMLFCADYEGAYTPDDIPTPVPTPIVPDEIIEIY